MSKNKIISNVWCDYIPRLESSSLLVIGASGYPHENDRFSVLDPNYIPVGLDSEQTEPIKGSPLRENWASYSFWGKLNERLKYHKFSQILIDGGTLDYAVRAEQEKICAARGLISDSSRWRIGDNELLRFVDFIICAAEGKCDFYLHEYLVPDQSPQPKVKYKYSPNKEKYFYMIQKLWINGFVETGDSLLLDNGAMRYFKFSIGISG